MVDAYMMELDRTMEEATTFRMVLRDSIEPENVEQGNIIAEDISDGIEKEKDKNSDQNQKRHTRSKGGVGDIFEIGRKRNRLRKVQ